MRQRAALALSALGAVLAITVAWWALALWPAGEAPPVWLERTRAVCFGVDHSGLPDVGGWIVLVGEPAGMIGFLLVVWGADVREALGALRRSAIGRFALVGVVGALVAGAGAATARVAAPAPAGSRVFDPTVGVSTPPTRLGRQAPALALVDQHGDSVRLAEFLGRPVVVAFAYGHCETVCPLLVHDAVGAVERTGALGTVLLIVTLDPWRDTPTRLASIADAWRLPPHARLLGGRIDAVERALDLWGIARARDEKTGAIVHPTSVYLVDRRGHLAFVASGDAPHLAALIALL